MIPAKADKWAQVMSPYDVVDYVFDANGLLDLTSGEGVASMTLTLDPDAVNLGLTVGTGQYATTQISANKWKVWFSIDPTKQDDPAFDNVVSLPMTMKIVTTSTPARTRERVMVLKVGRQ